jgi:N6-adenosine-specific RNA methylase IME4
MSINEAYKEIKKEEVELKRKEIRDTFEKQDVEIKDKKYRIIYADPPWKYGNSMPLGTTEPQDYYLLMDTHDICAMPIKDITEKDAVLFLWSTSPHLPEALEVAKAWGFTYKTTFIWDKIKHNMGHYNSVRHEILLVCTKGACTPDVKRLFDSVVSEERTEHSKKPNVFREIIETIYTYGNKIELFARETPEGWDVFGNQSNN